MNHRDVCMSIAKLWKAWRKSPEAEFTRWPTGRRNPAISAKDIINETFRR